MVEDWEEDTRAYDARTESLQSLCLEGLGRSLETPISEG